MPPGVIGTGQATCGGFEHERLREVAGVSGGSGDAEDATLAGERARPRLAGLRRRFELLRTNSSTCSRRERRAGCLRLSLRVRLLGLKMYPGLRRWWSSACCFAASYQIFCSSAESECHALPARLDRVIFSGEWSSSPLCCSA